MYMGKVLAMRCTIILTVVCGVPRQSKWPLQKGSAVLASYAVFQNKVHMCCTKVKQEAGAPG